MKTPKRHYELTTMEHCATERVWDRQQEEVSAQRWKRKNRVKQLKRTIARLKREKEEAYHRGHKVGYGLCIAHYPLTDEEKHRFMTEAFGIPDETDGKEQECTRTCE